jgi:solute carrier family 25 aspartate/glutamate transporter 12/13
MDQVERIIRDATAKSKDGRITAADFLNEAAHSLRYGIFTPMEANIIWHFASRGSGDSSMRLANVDFDALLDPKVCRSCGLPSSSWIWLMILAVSSKQWTSPQQRISIDSSPSVDSKGFMDDFFHSVYNFGLGGIAGGIGAFAVYPIDLVKTR